MAQNRGKRLMVNTMVFTLGKFISKLLVFAMMRLYTWCLSPAEFSAADLIVNLANLLIPLACLGIGEGIFRSAAARASDKQAVFSNGLCVWGVGSLVFLLLSPLIGWIPSFESAAWLVALYVVVSNLHTVVSQYLCAIGRTKLFAAQGILNTAITIALNILFLPVLGLGVNGFVLSIILADFLTTVFLILYTRLWRHIVIRAVAWKAIRSLLKFCLPLVPTTLFWWITGVSDRYMVNWMCSPAVNGLYTAAYKIPTLLIYAINIFDSAWKLSVAGEADNPDDCRSFFSGVWPLYTTVSFLGGAALMLLSPVFSFLLFAADFREAWVYIPVLTVATVFTALDTFLGSVYYARKKTVWSMITAFAGAGLNIALNFLLIPSYGAMGASIATFASYFIVCILRLITVRRMLKFPLEIGRGAANTVLIGLMAAALTMTETGGMLSPVWLWVISVALGIGMLALNARALLGLLRGLKRMLHR